MTQILSIKTQMRNKLVYCLRTHGLKFIKIDTIVASGVKRGNTTYLVNVKMLTESWLTLFWYVNILATEGVD